MVIFDSLPMIVMLRSEILRTYDFFIYKLITICLITVAGNLFVHINSEIIEYKF